MNQKENNFEVLADPFEPPMELSEISNYAQKLRKAITKILEKSFGREPKEIFETIVEEGACTLDAKCCSIFLLEEATSILRLMDASGSMGEKLKREDAWYYVPKRPLLTKKDRKKKDDKINRVILQYRQRKQETRTETEKRKFVEDRKSWVDNENLPIGITTYVVKEGKGVIAHGVAVREHPEWLGGYEDVQGEICTSLIEVPLKVGEKILGVIKIENHVKSPEITDFEDLKKKDVRSQIKLFGPQHKEVISILADGVALAIQELLYKEKSYKNVFGGEILKEAEFLLSESVSGSKNKDVSRIINNFCKDVAKWDIIGIDNIYQRIIELAEDILKKLGLSEPYLSIFKDLVKYETLLRATDVSYREHFLHQFQVFLLGYCIINKNKHIQNLLKGYLKGRGISDRHQNSLLDDVVTCWFLASIFHDLAYSIERIHRWLGSYFGVIFPPPRGHKISDKPEELLKELQLTIPWGNIFSMYDGVFDYHKTKLSNLICERIGVEMKLKRVNENINRNVIGLLNKSLVGYQDHGLFGGLILMHVSEGKTNQIIINEASLAVALHSPQVYKRLKELKKGKIQPQNFPFAFLLVYCDNAQQWGRPQMKELVEGVEIKITAMEIAERKINIILDYRGTVNGPVLNKINEPWENWQKCIDKEICLYIESRFKG